MSKSIRGSDLLKRIKDLEKENQELRKQLGKCKALLRKRGCGAQAKSIVYVKEAKTEVKTQSDWDPSVWPNIPYKCPCRKKYFGLVPKCPQRSGITDCCCKHCLCQFCL